MAAHDELLPSEVRARVLREHATLKARMEAVARECREADGNLRGSIDRLVEALGVVLDVEHELLLPTLRTIDAWGAERARRLSAWHIDVRARIERIRRDVAERTPQELSGRALEFVVALRDDLAEEERLHLARELLRELPMPADLGGD